MNTAAPTVDLEVNGLAKIGNVTIGANPLYAFTSHTFDNANATGRLGPTLSACRTRYQTSAPTATWAQDITNNYLNMTNNGIQLWTVPVTGTYTIRAKGAAGFIGPGLSNARGIDIQTTTTLIKGEVIKILVGQRGSTQGLYANMGSGGGGSFVVREISTPIIIAGGGGGTGGSNNSYVNSDASRETYGMNGSGNIDSYGNNGGGGKGGQGSGGGGFLQDGFAGINNNIPPSSFLTGGVGGLATGGLGVGGFGGGGYAQDTTGYQTGGGGGGGYSGGGGGLNNDPGGGGGSFAISTMTVNGYNTDHGSVTITLLSPSSDFDVSGVSRLSASSATATALTTTGRIGVNTATPTVDLEVNGLAKIGNVTIGANPLYAFTGHTFTNAGATGRLGPTLSNVRTTYANAGATWANSYLNMTNNGIQLWTVPVTGNYIITALGAADYSNGGKGRYIQLTITLIKGEVIQILVGQQGGYNVFGQSSGGGGTFVVRDTQTPIIVAGGGGGKGYAGAGSNTNASLSTSGNNSSNGGAGGTNGQGGVGSADGGGGGMFGNGGGGSEGGLSFINGGSGGIGTTDGTPVDGGFGGGGGGNGGEGGGGGGGYSGGGGGAGGASSIGGGGGGSYGITPPTDFGAINTGHGSVNITLLSPSSDFDVSGVSRMSASSATATALTTTGRIGVNTAAPTADLDVVGQGNILYGLILGSSTNSTFIGHLAQKLSIYHDTNARIFLRYGNSEGMLIGNYSGGSFITHRETTGELEFYTEQNTPIVFRTQKNINSANRLTITGAGNVGIGTAAPTVALDVSGAANVSNYLSVGSSSGTTTSTLPNAFYVRTGGSNWRDYIPLLTANSTTNIQTWGGPDTQWYDVTVGAQNEIAMQYSYFAAYWLNANRAVNNTSFSVNSYAITTGEVTPTLRGTFTFTASVLIDGIVTGYTGVLSQGNHGTRTLTAQQDGINAGVARRQTLIMGGRVETGFLNVTGNINIAGSININSCKPRIAVTSNLYRGLKKSFIIPLALRSGGLIANKVYFTIRVPTISGTNTLYLKPNGSATTFHSYNQQIAAGGFSQNGTNSSIGFKVCDVIGATAGSGYTLPTHANIVGEFTIIRDNQLWGGTTPNLGTFPFTTRIYGTLVQYGNNYIQKWDFQGQALTGSNSDIYDRIDSFQFITSDTSVESDTGVSVTIEGD